MEVTERPFPFLSLPAELRLNVYAHLLLDTHSYILPIANLPPTRPQNVSKSLHPTILRVCKLIHIEAVPVLYGQNTWMIRTFPLKNCVPELTAYIGRENAGKIRRVVCVYNDSPRLKAVDRGRRDTDVARVKERYEMMGIKWDDLYMWSCRISAGQKHMEWMECGEVEDIGTEQIRRLGIEESWFEVLQTALEEWSVGAEWIVKKRCLPMGCMMRE